eukprot:NODE_16875_length_218_cov_142.368098.p3 GENE.NODE_16875_length_218_cov_142.368098~~NODE_16875_length_218_cov_142.368098.p3  ORF type:complete len:58 (+),score=0.99 NODE_16875_length_218_cov_142.368098:3-176(+)
MGEDGLSAPVRLRACACAGVMLLAAPPPPFGGAAAAARGRQYPLHASITVGALNRKR